MSHRTRQCSDSCRCQYSYEALRIGAVATRGADVSSYGCKSRPWLPHMCLARHIGIHHGLSTTAAAFLRDVGLPASVAPFLDFRPPKSGPLPTVDQLWRLKDGKFGNFYVIGSNGSGDSIAIALSGSVVYLNHDDGFRPCYINKDVLALSETLLRFREMIQEAAKRNGSTFVYGQVPREAVDTMREHLRSYDPTALDEGAMWADELDEIDSERT